MTDEEYTLDEWADGLIELANFAKAHPDVFTYVASWDKNGVERPDLPDPVTIVVPTHSPERLGVMVKRLGGGQKYSETFASSSSTGVKRRFGPHEIDVYSPSDAVCTPKRKERRQVPVVELTDEAKEQIEAIRKAHTRLEDKEVVTEWDCPPSLLALAPQSSASASEEVPDE